MAFDIEDLIMFGECLLEWVLAALENFAIEIVPHLTCQCIGFCRDWPERSGSPELEQTKMNLTRFAMPTYQV